MRPPLQGARVVVTGASSGIGREIARQLAPEAAALILAARRAGRLEALRDELCAAHPRLRVEVVACDLGTREGRDALVAAAGEIDVLINNAGMGDIGMFDRARWDKTATLLAINIDALTYLTHRFLPPMIARRRGAILNVSSGFGLEFMPGFATYAASKHYVTAFTEAVRIEARAAGVVVSQLCPGPVATEFEEVAGNFTGRQVPRLVRLEAADCVRRALRGFRRGRALIVPGVVINLVLFLGALSPRWLKRALYGFVAPRIRRLQEQNSP